MTCFSIKKINVVTFTLACLISTGIFAIQHSSLDDYSTIQQWLKSEGFKTYSLTDQGVSLTDIQSNTSMILQALHTFRTDLFYHYLAQHIIVEKDQNKPLLSQLLKSQLNLNTFHIRAYETLIAGKNIPRLAHWLQHYIELDKHLDYDKDFHSNFFLILTQATTNKALLCPEATMLDYLRSKNAKRRTSLQCLARIININIIDINISRNRVVTSKIVSPDSSGTHGPAPSILENSKDHIMALLDYYNTPDTAAIILLTSPNGKEFVTPIKAKSEKPLNKVKEHKSLERLSGKKSERKENNSEPVLKSKKKEVEHWMVLFIKSPGYSTLLWTGGTIVAMLVMFYAPYPGNVFLNPPRT